MGPCLERTFEVSLHGHEVGLCLLEPGDSEVVAEEAGHQPHGGQLLVDGGLVGSDAGNVGGERLGDGELLLADTGLGGGDGLATGDQGHLQQWITLE